MKQTLFLSAILSIIGANALGQTNCNDPRYLDTTYSAPIIENIYYSDHDTRERAYVYPTLDPNTAPILDMYIGEYHYFLINAKTGKDDGRQIFNGNIDYWASNINYYSIYANEKPANASSENTLFPSCLSEYADNHPDTNKQNQRIATGELDYTRINNPTSDNPERYFIGGMLTDEAPDGTIFTIPITINQTIGNSFMTSKNRCQNYYIKLRVNARRDSPKIENAKINSEGFIEFDVRVAGTYNHGFKIDVKNPDGTIIKTYQTTDEVTASYKQETCYDSQGGIVVPASNQLYTKGYPQNACGYPTNGVYITNDNTNHIIFKEKFPAGTMISSRMVFTSNKCDRQVGQDISNMTPIAPIVPTISRSAYINPTFRVILK